MASVDRRLVHCLELGADQDAAGELVGYDNPDYAGQLAEVTAFAGGSTWARIMFERKMLGEDYWARQAALRPRVYPTVAATTDALVRGESIIAPLAYAIVALKRRDGAPRAMCSRRRRAVVLFRGGHPENRDAPSRGAALLDWSLSEEGQAFMIRELGHLTALKVPPLQPEGFDPAIEKLWFANITEFDRLRAAWLDEWSKVYGFRQ